VKHEWTIWLRQSRPNPTRNWNKGITTMKIKPFSLGQLVATPGALAELSPERIAEIVSRHLSGDWGTVGAEDWHLNDLSTHDGTRLLSSYWLDETDHGRGKVWIITEATNDEDVRESTCILKPEEY